jgi:hypothetical protein
MVSAQPPAKKAASLIKKEVGNVGWPTLLYLNVSYFLCALGDSAVKYSF